MFILYLIFKNHCLEVLLGTRSFSLSDVSIYIYKVEISVCMSDYNLKTSLTYSYKFWLGSGELGRPTGMFLPLFKNSKLSGLTLIEKFPSWYLYKVSVNCIHCTLWRIYEWPTLK